MLDVLFHPCREKKNTFISEKHNILLHNYNFTFASNKQQIVLRMSYFSPSLRYSLISSLSSLAGTSLESINQALEYV